MSVSAPSRTVSIQKKRGADACCSFHTSQGLRIAQYCLEQDNAEAHANMYFVHYYHIITIRCFNGI